MNTSPTLESLIERHSDPIKAVLLILVAADHNDWFRILAPNLFRPLTFHVLGFFLLAFTFGSKPFSLHFMTDRLVRYLVPFWFALTGASIAYALMLHGNFVLNERLFSWAKAALIGNAPFVKSSSGLLMLWFLPALFGLSCLLAAYNLLQTAKAKSVATGVALTAHLLLPLIQPSDLLYLPFGLAIAMNIFILGLVWLKLLDWQFSLLRGIVVIVTFVLSYGLLVANSTNLEIATLDLAGIDRGSILLLQDAAGMTGVLALVYLVARLPRLNFLQVLGNNSLLVYLLHPVAYLILAKALPLNSLTHSDATSLFLYGCATTIVALVFACGLALLITRSAFLSAWITPRSWANWPPAKRFRQQ